MRALVRCAGLCVLIPSCLLIALLLAADVVGVLLTYACGMAAVALAAVLSGGIRRRVALIAGCLMLLAAGASRLPALEQRSPLRVISLPSASATPWVNALVPEREGAILAAELLDLPREGDDLLPAVLRTAYARMDAALDRPVPTPAVATYLGMQSPERFDAIAIEPRGPKPPRAALIFLHGYAGNFDLYCWYAARAAQATRSLVVCPSLGPRGDFWQLHGLLTVRATLRYLHARGIERVVLAGLSNGAVGAGVIAGKVSRELDGLVLISGAPRGAPPPLPLLVIQGTRDSMMLAAHARRYARASARSSYVAIDGGHFVFLSHSDRVTAELGGFLARRFADPLAQARYSARTD